MSVGQKSSEDHWDEEVFGEDASVWTNLSHDLVGLDTLEFLKYTLSEDDLADIYIFCDALKAAYGYAAYVHQGGITNLIFAKPKVAPLKSKSSHHGNT